MNGFTRGSRFGSVSARCVLGRAAAIVVAVMCLASRSAAQSPAAATTQPAASTEEPAATRPAGKHPTEMTGPERARLALELGQRALVAFESGNFAQANRFAEEALQLRQDQPEAMLVYAMLFNATGQTRDALPLLERYIKSDTGRNDFRGYEIIGDIFAKSNQAHIAARHYNTALRWAPSAGGKRNVKAEIQMKLAEAQSQLGRNKDAVEKAEEAAGMLGRSATLQWGLAKIYRRAGREADADKAMDSALKLLRDELATLLQQAAPDTGELARKLAIMQEIHQTRVRILTAAAERPTPGTERSAAEAAAARVALARATAEQGDNERDVKLLKCVALLQEATTIEPNNAAYYVDLADYEVVLGMRAAAAAHLQKALELDPSSSAARERLSLLGVTPPASTTQVSGAPGASPLP